MSKNPLHDITVEQNKLFMRESENTTDAAETMYLIMHDYINEKNIKNPEKYGVTCASAVLEEYLDNPEYKKLKDQIKATFILEYEEVIKNMKTRNLEDLHEQAVLEAISAFPTMIKKQVKSYNINDKLALKLAADIINDIKKEQKKERTAAKEEKKAIHESKQSEKLLKKLNKAWSKR